MLMPPNVIAVTGLAFEARIAAGRGVDVLCATERSRLLEWLEASTAYECSGIISFGIAGGLDRRLSPGDWVVASSVVTDTGQFPADPIWARRLLSIIPSSIHAAISGVDAPLADPAAKFTCPSIAWNSGRRSGIPCCGQDCYCKKSSVRGLQSHSRPRFALPATSRIGSPLSRRNTGSGRCFAFACPRPNPTLRAAKDHCGCLVSAVSPQTQSQIARRRLGFSAPNGGMYGIIHNRKASSVLANQ
jgi:hypothetical protein